MPGTESALIFTETQGNHAGEEFLYAIDLPTRIRYTVKKYLIDLLMYQDFSCYEKTVGYKEVLWRKEMAVSRRGIIVYLE